MKKIIVVLSFLMVVSAAISAESWTESSYGTGIYTRSSLVIRENLLDSMEELARSSVTRTDLANILDCIMIQCQKSLIDPVLVLSIIATESNFKASAISCTGAENGRGLMQVSEIALKDYNRVNKTHYNPDDLFNIEVNTMIGMWSYIQNSNYGIKMADTVKMLSAYNLGYKYAKSGMIAENYCKKVFSNYEKLRWEM